MQILILDQHRLLEDSRRSRHITVCLDEHYKIFRIHINSSIKPRESEISYLRDIPIYHYGIKRTTINLLNHRINLMLLLVGNKRIWENVLSELQLNKEEITIIHVHDPQLLILAGYLKHYFNKARIVYDRHETYEKFSLFRNWSLSCCIEKLMKMHVDGVVITVDAYQKATQCRFPRAIVCSVPNYPILDAKIDALVEDKLSKPCLPTTITFVYIGSLYWTRRNKYSIYDISPILFFAEKLITKGYDVRFIIGGKSVSKEMTDEFIRLEKAYPNRFVYTGYVSYDQLIEYTLDSTFGFFLTNPNTKYWVFRSSNKIFEFLGCGVIPITREDAYPENIRDISLMFSRYASTIEILEKIETLLHNPDQILAMREKLRLQRGQYSFKYISTNYITLYDTLWK